MRGRLARLAPLARLACTAVVLGAAARPAAAQARAQLRADVLTGDRLAVHAGAGVETDAGLYARLALVGGAGVSDVGGDGAASARVEGVARFLLDPLRESRRGPYLGGGVGVRYDDGDRARGYLLAVIGVEGGGPGRRGWAPALEVGIGGGARVSVVLRRARPNGR